MPRRFLPAEWERRKLIHAVLAFREKSIVVVQIIGGLAAVILGVMTSSPGQWSGWKLAWIIILLVLAVLTLVVGPIMESRCRTSGLALEAEHDKTMRRVTAERDGLRKRHAIDKVELRRSIESVAQVLLHDCELMSTNSRISVYQHEADHAEFIQVGRVSVNPEWRKPGRPTYPDDLGHIAEGWREMTVYQTNGRVTPEKWAEAQARKGMDYDVAMSISMKSRSYLGVRLDYADKSVGMVMAESLDSDGVAAELADTIRSHNSIDQLAAMLAVAPKLPVVKEYARERTAG